jgi:hypothetical protein
MTLISGVGFSNHRDPREAGRLAARQALDNAGISTPDFVFLFGTVGYRQEALVQAVRKATGNAPLSGCSGEGVIVEGASHETNFGATVCVVKSDEVSFRNASAKGMSKDPEGMGQRIGDALGLADAKDILTLISLADGLTLNFDAMLRGLMHRCESQHHIPVVGGTASDDWSFKATYQYHDDQVIQDGTVATLLQGKCKIATSAKHGCVPVGEELIVTRAESNRILEFNGRPALNVIDEYLTVEEQGRDWKKTNVYLAIGIRAPETMRHYDDYLIRFMPMRDDASGSVYVPTEIASGTRCFMTRRDHDKIQDGNVRLADEIKHGLDGAKPRFLLQIECIGRGQVIFNDTEKQKLMREMQRNVGGESAPWFGVYTYGEFAPVGGINSFHNYSLIVTAIA